MTGLSWDTDRTHIYRPPTLVANIVTLEKSQLNWVCLVIESREKIRIHVFLLQQKFYCVRTTHRFLARSGWTLLTMLCT